MTSAKDVHMQMKNGLAGLGAVVEHHPVVRNPLFSRGFVAYPHQLPDQSLVLGADRRGAGEMLFGDD